ncbi:hypothetical protein [Paraburkholderia flagellata]|uniref:hypothetical protein n=1 Tax=Paraburkholderia flagellata TaxID=2883241 RepID=UPI001F18BBC3|nr:hypothetical protein [Paraburkholderia flagellata]
MTVELIVLQFHRFGKGLTAPFARYAWREQFVEGSTVVGSTHFADRFDRLTNAP